MSADHTETSYPVEDGEDDGESRRAAGSPSSLSSLTSFQYRTIHHEGGTQIVLRGAVEDEDKDAFRRALFQRRDDPNEPGVGGDDTTRDIALDLGDVSYLSEEAIAVLIQLLKAQRRQGAALRLVRTSSWVRRKLERTAILQFFVIDD
jgi:anti-anti-sigma factor